MSHNEINLLVEQIFQGCMAAIDDNLHWGIYLVVEDDEVSQVWTGMDVDETNDEFKDELGDALNDLGVDGRDWRLDFYVEDELERTWRSPESLRVAG